MRSLAICCSQASAWAGGLPSASKAAAAMRISSNVLTLSPRYFDAPASNTSRGTPSSTAASTPTAVLLTVTLPPGSSAKPPLSLSKQPFTKSAAPCLFGTSAPMYLRARTAALVALTLDFVAEASGAKPPSFCWSFSR